LYEVAIACKAKTAWILNSREQPKLRAPAQCDWVGVARGLKRGFRSLSKMAVIGPSDPISS
jgi:hypothetical protein